VISSWTALLSYVRVCLAEQPREQFRALFLDARNRLLRDELVTHGTVDHAPVYPREVIRRALELSAAALILVHNHPSGDPTPSQADIEMTRQIVEAGRVWSGASFPVSHISSTLRCASRSSRRLDCTRFRYP